MNYTTSEENYLKAIFHLQLEEGTVTTNMLAERLQTRPASVTDMMKKLNTKKLLHYKPYYGFSLSPEGKKIALYVIRRHRLWEYFLSKKLNIGWSEVHPIAEELEHVSSRKLIDKLDEYLGFPGFDPHGDPIPDSKGKMRDVSKIPLEALPLHQPAEVCQVANQSPELLELLHHRHIGIGTRIEVKKRFGFDNSMEVKVKSQSFTISQQLASYLYVKKN
ncbi:MAG TPA: metal-dependent transcriptional regulator [Flavisolibacter sp.]|nr:metal-dependent transcriptional regulator [Flavisolibacter sp.]